MKINGVECCPFCGSETEFDVEEGMWVVHCSNCDAPILLCDKCYTLNGNDRDCSECPHTANYHDELAKWQAEMTGQIVYWKDPDNDICSNYMKVKGFRDDCYVLTDRNGDGETEAPYCEVRRLSKEDQEKVLKGWTDRT